MTPSDAQVEKAARVIALRSMLPLGDGARAIAAAILTPVLTDIEGQIKALPHTNWVDPNGRPRPCPEEWPGGRCTCVRGQALAAVRGELP